MTTSLAPAPAVPTGSLSPSTSPRLPSPPPFPEIQLSPKSPQSDSTGDLRSHDFDTSTLDNGASRRIRPGTKAADMASGPPLIPLSDLDSPFQLQEHLKALYYHSTKSDKFNTTIAITRETALKLATPPDNVDRPLWLYELCRFLVQRTNSLIVACFSDSPPCSCHTCPEMRASEWQYLCAVHDPPKSCCAIDYCCHTLDWAANILTSQKHFPSRLTLGSEAAGGSQQSVKQLTNIFRRVYRMFAHAWFQHREVFWNVEGHEGLYIFFKTVCDVYNLIPEDNYTIPSEAEGIVTEPHDQKEPPHQTLLERSSSDNSKSNPLLDTQDPSHETATTISTGATTRRHKHTPSTGSSVTTILEGEEDDHHIREDVSSTTSPATPEPMYQSEPPIMPVASVVKMESHPLPAPPPIKIETEDKESGERKAVEHETAGPIDVHEGEREEEEKPKIDLPPIPTPTPTKNETPAPQPQTQTQTGTEEEGSGEEKTAAAEAAVGVDVSETDPNQQKQIEPQTLGQEDEKDELK